MHNIQTRIDAERQAAEAPREEQKEAKHKADSHDDPGQNPKFTGGGGGGGDECTMVIKTDPGTCWM